MVIPVTAAGTIEQTTSFNEFLNRGRHSASGKWGTIEQVITAPVPYADVTVIVGAVV